MWNKSFSFLALLGLLFVNALFFQNCGMDGFQVNGNIDQSSINLDVSENHPGLNKPIAAANAVPLYANRELVSNILVSVFGKKHQWTFVKEIGYASTDFGGAWGAYSRLPSSDCSENPNPLVLCENQTAEYKSNPSIIANSPREGRRIMACHLGAEDDESLEFALKRIQKEASLSAPPELSRQNLERSFRIFFGAKRLPQEAFFDALKLTHQGAESPLEGWRSIVLGICLSPHWQVL